MDTKVRAVTLHGAVARGYEPVREAFARNFSRGDDYEEVGAALCVYQGSERVVDLWAGHADRERTRGWQADTLINGYSTTKGLAAVAFAMLVEEGRVRYDDPVVKHWPEYGAEGKARTTVAQLLSHQSGLSGFAEPTTVEMLYDWTAVCARLARQKPFWVPGENTSYHAMTWGFLVGEVFRRAAGVTLGAYFARHVAKALNADVFIGLPEREEPRVAAMLRPRSAPDLAALTQPPMALAALVNPQLDPEVCNARAWRACEIPAANGQLSARGIARVYAALANGGELDGVRVLLPGSIEHLTQIQSPRTDLLLGFANNWALGLSANALDMLGPEPDTFGHSGWGGSFGAFNARKNVAIGYVCNQMGAQLVGDPRGASLCAAVFGCVQ